MYMYGKRFRILNTKYKKKIKGVIILYNTLVKHTQQNIAEEYLTKIRENGHKLLKFIFQPV